MQEPPKMVSTKDCMHITDILNVTLANAKKFKHYNNEIVDEQLKTLVSTVTSSLTKEYNTLLGVLNNE